MFGKQPSNQLEFTAGENVNNSLYSGGSSLIGLNYAFGPQKSSKPQEILVLKI